MGRTIPYTETIKKLAKDDPRLGAAILAEASELFLRGEVAASKIMIRDFVKATMGFEALGKQIDKNPKSIMRMLSAKGNPTAENFTALMVTLQKHEGIRLKVQAAG
jgi:DNA-binding phage protein